MNIRHFQPGDEHAQLTIYNTVGASLPKFKPATLFEIQKRTHARDFDPATRWFVEDQGEIVAYAGFQANGRVSYPWCLPGKAEAAQPLFSHLLQTMRQRGIRKAFAAYREDWPTINGFFASQGFLHVRDMINFLLTFENMPTAASIHAGSIAPAEPADVAKIFALAPSVFRVPSAAALQEALWNNPYFSPKESLYVLRSRSSGVPVAAGVFITTPTYADPRLVDSAMPCFRLGAFGTEGLSTKRIKGLFSFVAAQEKSLFSLGMDLLGHAARLLGEEDDISCFAAQAASDVPLLLSFYQRHFERQGSFPVYERDLSA